MSESFLRPFALSGLCGVAGALGVVALGPPGGLCALPVALLAGWWGARREARPHAELAAAARRLAGGGGPELPPLPGAAAEVSVALAALAARLHQSVDEVARDREQLRTVLAGMAEGVVAFDADQRVLFANARAAQLLEFPAAGAVGRRLWELTRQLAVLEAAERGLTGDAPHRHELDWKGDAERSLAVTVARLPADGRDAPGAVMVLNDTTEIRRLERLRQDFVANVSHELKTPLANIKSSVEVLLDGAADDPAIRGGFLIEIDEQAERLDRLVADLLSLARVESGGARFDYEAVGVEDAVHACLDRHRTRAEAKGLRLDGVALAGCPPDLAAWADEESLAQILDNLVDNAIKYTPAGGRVTARWEADAREVRIEVEDSGVGIPARDLPRVFERFYRVDKARSRELGGTGLGLAIVKHMAQAMQGGVSVRSEGRGTTFRVCLPRAGRGE